MGWATFTWNAPRMGIYGTLNMSDQEGGKILATLLGDVVSSPERDFDVLPEKFRASLEEYIRIREYRGFRVIAGSFDRNTKEFNLQLTLLECEA